MGFFSDLFGGSARKDLRRANAEATAALKTGYDAATGRYGEAHDALTPYETQGREANAIYGQAIGLGTPEEQKAAQQRYFADPAMQAVLGQQSNALLRKYNANSSGTGGGRLALAGTRVGLENYSNWLDRLQGQGAQGGQFATNQSNVKMGQGDLDFGYGATRAGNAINYGGAMAQSRSIGINNLLNIAGVGIKAAKLF